MATSGNEPRTPEAIIDDWRTAIADTEVQNALRKQILDRHPARTGNLDPGTGRPLAIAAVADRRVPLLVVAGQILVRQEDVAMAKPLLAGMGFGDPQPIGCAGDGSGPDLTGYASREWMIEFIKNPAHEKFYGDKNDRMPLFGEKGELTPRQIEMIVDWLRTAARY